MQRFRMMCGLPASGKSWLAEKFTGVVIHSSDKLRAEMFGSVDVQERNNELFNELHRRIIVDLKAGKDVVYDATNISYKKRMNFLNQIKDISCDKICCVMATPYELCLKQNENREKKVDPSVITRMYKNFTIPMYYEGWDGIELHFHDDAINNYEPYDSLKKRLDTIEQDNPHHNLTIGHHMDRCVEELDKLMNNPTGYWKRAIDYGLLRNASMIHDIGKEFTKSYNTEKGHAVFYQHHLVGAYMAMFLAYYEWDLPDVVILEICNYIQWHMQPFFINSEKADKKFADLVGQRVYEDLKILNEADRRAK